MKRIKHYMAALAAVSFMAVSVAGLADDESKATPQPEEVLNVIANCNTFDPSFPSEVSLYFQGTGDLTSASGTLSFNDTVELSTCEVVITGLRAVLEGLPCENTPVRSNEYNSRFIGVCQARRAELVNVMGEVSRSLIFLLATPVP